MCAYVLHILYSGCILECRDKPTSHCLTDFYTHGNNLIPISVFKILVHLVHFCLARTVKLDVSLVVASLCRRCETDIEIKLLP